MGVTAICPGVINTPIIDSTCFLGQRDSETSRQRTKQAFNRGHSPDAVAKAIVKSVERNSPVVPVGVETWVGWVGRRLLPPPAATSSSAPTWSGRSRQLEKVLTMGWAE